MLVLNSGVFRFQVMTANNQATEDLKDQMELRRLYANCDQVRCYTAFLIQTKENLFVCACCVKL